MKSNEQKPLRVAVIGAGIAGIITAIEFKKKLGIDVALFEREGGPGGTWRVNTYPGCACDVRSQWYSYSQELNPEWSAAYSKQAEIQAYWVNLFHKYKLEDQTRFNTSFKRADWDSEKKLYKIQFEDRENGNYIFEYESEILISAIGGFSTPVDRPPGMKGLDDFRGKSFHSARWDHTVDLKGKRVGVIGNGCSAAQFIPEIAKDPSVQVINFSRTPSWFMPRLDYQVSDKWKWMYAHVPLLQFLARAYTFLKADSGWIVWILGNVRIRNAVEKQLIAYIKAKAPKKYHDFLIPKYPMGCKRIIVDPGYLKCLNEPNVRLITDPIETVTETGIKCVGGQEERLDILILGTGFDLSERGMGIAVYNNERCLTDRWAEQGGPQAYLGTTVAGYPNFYMLLGPNVATGHTSAIAHIESQIHYVVEMTRAMRRYGVSRLELKEEAEAQYNQWLKKRLDNTVWQGSCVSWYKTVNGKVTAMWPGTYAYFYWVTRKPNFEHYVQEDGRDSLTDVKRREARLKKLKWASGALLALATVLKLR